MEPTRFHDVEDDVSLDQTGVKSPAQIPRHVPRMHRIADPLFAPFLATFCVIVGVLFAISVRYELDDTGVEGGLQ